MRIFHYSLFIVLVILCKFQSHALKPQKIKLEKNKIRSRRKRGVGNKGAPHPLLAHRFKREGEIIIDDNGDVDNLLASEGRRLIVGGKNRLFISVPIKNCLVHVKKNSLDFLETTIKNLFLCPLSFLYRLYI